MKKALILIALLIVSLSNGKTQVIDFEKIAFEYILNNNSIIEIDSNVEKIKISEFFQYHDDRLFYELISGYSISDHDQKIIDNGYLKKKQLLEDAINEWNKLHQNEIKQGAVIAIEYNGTFYISKKMTRKSEEFLQNKCPFYVPYTKTRKKFKYNLSTDQNKFTFKYNELKNKKYVDLTIYQHKYIDSDNIAVVEFTVTRMSPTIHGFVFIDSSGKVLKHYKFYINIGRKSCGI